MISLILAAFAGLFMGLSIGLGFRPIFEQPKNIKIQVCLGVTGINFLVALFGYLGFL